MKTIQEIANCLLPDECNAILQSEKLKRPLPLHGNIYYIDMSGIIRINNYNGKWVLVDGFCMPSRIKGKTIQELWTEINDDA